MRPRISNEEDGLVTVLKTLKTKVNLVAMLSGYNQPLSESPLGKNGGLPRMARVLRGTGLLE